MIPIHIYILILLGVIYPQYSTSPSLVTNIDALADADTEKHSSIYSYVGYLIN